MEYDKHYRHTNVKWVLLTEWHRTQFVPYLTLPQITPTSLFKCIEPWTSTLVIMSALYRKHPLEILSTCRLQNLCYMTCNVDVTCKPYIPHHIMSECDLFTTMSAKLQKCLCGNLCAPMTTNDILLNRMNLSDSFSLCTVSNTRT